MFLVYGDESLDEKKERVCAVAGLVGLEDWWAALERKWKALHGEVPFHANNCESDHGDYEPKPGEDVDANHCKNQELYKRSAILLAESDIGGYASAYDLAAQRQAFPPPYAPPVYFQPFLDVMEAMRNFADHKEDNVEFIFDTRAESEYNAGLIYAHIRESHPAWRERIAEKISFVSSRKNTRIQIADLFAREAMKMLDSQLGPVKRPLRKSWLALTSTGRFKVIVRSHEHFAEAKQQIKSIDSITDMSDGGYAAWLQGTGRVGNVTNYFEYLIRNLKGLSEEERQDLGEKLK
jgi:hypothetical protein